MKTNICLLFFLLCAGSPVAGQYAQLVLIHKETQKERVIKSGDFAVVFTHDGKKWRGKMEIASATAIRLDQHTIDLEEILQIRARTSKVRTVAGVTLVLAGLPGTIYAVSSPDVLVAEDPGYAGLVAWSWSSLLMVGVGVPLLIIKDKYDTREWSLDTRIINPYPSRPKEKP